ncbi:flavin reductase family protein [Chthonobacter albigriseus]|uniref:flavin reductase family protein n=1 Tax=Chthonobacter albigriseus TaxID=1683161 RepID=UPI0015EF1ED6|nr:flavin reductase family protein [Chthonobacter albigriseus]
MNAVAKHEGDPLKAKFLGGMSSAAATVNVVTTDGPAGRFGVTVSAMSSVSADMEQPTLLVCVHERSATAGAILANGVFCVNVLRDDQAEVADVFAGRRPAEAGDKFSGIGWTPGTTGAPALAGALVVFHCRLLSHQQVGTHHVLIGAVEDVTRGHAGLPLIYQDRSYGRPARLSP